MTDLRTNEEQSQINFTAIEFPAYVKPAPKLEIPPCTNRGGLELTLKISNTYVEPILTPPTPQNKINAIVDYLSFTFALSGFAAQRLLKFPESSERDDWRNYSDFYSKRPEIQQPIKLLHETRQEREAHDLWLEQNPGYKSDFIAEQTDFTVSSSDEVIALCEQLQSIISDFEVVPFGQGLYGYKKSMHIYRDQCRAGLIAYDGNNGTCLVSLSGTGCHGVDMFKMRQFIEKLPLGKITRIDMAHDDLEGRIPLSRFVKMYHRGLYHTRGAMPNMRNITNMDRSLGNTMYIGNKKNGKELCVYEKGKQLGDGSSKWVRVEGRYTAVDRWIPFEVLTSPAVFLSAMYPALAYLCAFHEKITVSKKKANTVYSKYLDAMQISYGQGVTLMLEMGLNAQEIIDRISRPGVPKKFIVPF